MNIENLENEIQSWVAVQSEHSCQLAGDAFVVCANELAEFIKELFEKEKAKLEGCVVVPVEPTPQMIDSTWDDQKEIETMSHNSRNEFIYKKMIDVAIAEAARGGNE